MPSILNTKARRVLRYLNKHGFSNIKLTIYIMKDKSSLEQVVKLEQYFIDSLKPNLNVDLVAKLDDITNAILPNFNSYPLVFILSVLLVLCLVGINIMFNMANSMNITSTLDSVLFSPGYSVMFLVISPLFNKSNKGSSKNKEIITPVAVYSGDGIKLATKENKGKSGVYRWVNTLTGDTYVGSAVDLSKRFSVYFSQKSVKEVLSRSKSNILSAILKYDYSNFKLEILEYCESSQTIVREQHYLNLLCPEYNILSIASSTLGRLHSEETILKISNSLRGKSIPELVKQKMSLSRQGKVFSDETKKILSELRMGKDSPFLGKQHSADTRIKMSEALGSKIEVFNKNTLETTIYSSNYKAAEAIGCSESTIRYWLKQNRPYKGKYLFKKVN